MLALLLSLLAPVVSWAASSGDTAAQKVENGKIYVSGASGAVPYFSAANQLGTIAANAAATPKFLRQVSSAAPTWDTTPILSFVFLHAAMGGL